MAALEHIPAMVERVRRELVLARFVGKLVVDRGLQEARARLDHAVSVTAVDTTVDEPEVTDVTDVDETSEPEPTARPNVDDLALADYDQLPSAHIVAKLDGLDAIEREAIERYERSGRHRRTILGKLERIRQESGA